MKKPKPPTKVLGDARLKKTQQYAILSKAISLVAKSGPSKSEIHRLLALATRSATFVPNTKSNWLSGNIQTINVVITVLQSWHRNRALVDDSVNPLPIALLGSGQSVESVIRRDHPRCDAAKLAKEVYKLGFIERVGKNKYLPVDVKARFLGDHPLYLLRAIFFAVKFLETIEHNLSAKTDDERLVECAAHIENLPKAKLPAFKAISRQQTTALAELISNWLESNRHEKTSSKRTAPIVEAGLHVFAYATKPTP